MGNIAEQRPSSAETHQTLQSVNCSIMSLFQLQLYTIVIINSLGTQCQWVETLVVVHKYNNYFVKIVFLDYVRLFQVQIFKSYFQAELFS